MTPLKARARHIMSVIVCNYPLIPATELAEATAIELDREAWLDDDTHWIWEMAVRQTTYTERPW